MKELVDLCAQKNAQLAALRSATDGMAERVRDISQQCAGSADTSCHPEFVTMWRNMKAINRNIHAINEGINALRRQLGEPPQPHIKPEGG